MKKTKKKTTKKVRTRTMRVSIGTLPPRTKLAETRDELERVSNRLRNAASAQSAAELELKATRQQNQKLEARLFLLGAANMYLAERLVKAAGMIERAIASAELFQVEKFGAQQRMVRASAFDDVTAFCKGMI